MEKESVIYVAGHRGLVGSAITTCLRERGYRRIVTCGRESLDLEDGTAVDAFFARTRPEYVFLAAAKVGGIQANHAYPVDFLLRNLRIQNNVIEAAWRYGVKGLLFLGSSCIYPKMAPQPLKEDALLTGPLEPTNEAYAVAKIAGIELCEAFNRQYGTRFLTAMPTNLYGPGDNYDLETSHVLPALLRKFHLARLAVSGRWRELLTDETIYGPIPADFRARLAAMARQNGMEPDRSFFDAAPEKVRNSWREAFGARAEPSVPLWGTGRARREFLHSRDAAGACVFLMERLESVFAFLEAEPSDQGASRHLVNVGCGTDWTIAEIAERVARLVGYHGPVSRDRDRPDGTPRKLLDVAKLTSLGWRPSISLEDGIRRTYHDYLERLKAGLPPA